ncbi:hypothetical protein BV25DRAFT_1819025 [Artomyces pyxidatus]|uniref:Uncharacterized protein n=1 Tax=Artomyces pyxidatus TaxID=48021 RepID=A0ACB8TGW6_9AGAM|nr:hypothetical protein BV25DRAFT_1819025 [Artomyces pyxidatus]
MTSSLRVAGNGIASDARSHSFFDTPSRSRSSKEESPRTKRQKIAEDTLAAIDRGSFLLDGRVVDLRGPNTRTLYYPPTSELGTWRSTRAPESACHARIILNETTTIAAARALFDEVNPSWSSAPFYTVTRVGVLNFASAKKPGGGFKSGAQAQEESIARSSTLYPSLMTDKAQQFYALSRKKDPLGLRRSTYYTHAMIYSSNILVFRDDAGGWVQPHAIDVITCAAVNAGEARREDEYKEDPQYGEADIVHTMRERMARILFLFEKEGVRDIVLGSFGTGVFRNDVSAVANNWAALLVVDGARFRGSFDRVVFAIIGRETFDTFKAVIESHTPAEDVSSQLLSPLQLVLG